MMSLTEYRDRRGGTVLSRTAFGRAIAVALATGLACAGVLLVAAPAEAASPSLGAWAHATPVATVVDPSLPDADNDQIPDIVEQQVCGSLTCAVGTEDVDADGVPDWVEVMACGATRCADPGADVDGDGVPDYAELLVCGSTRCSNGHEDADGDGVADWAEVVICGTRTCATGLEDYNHNGTSDADELMGYVRYLQLLAETGSQWQWWVFLAVILALFGVGARMLARGLRVPVLPDAHRSTSELLGGAR